MTNSSRFVNDRSTPGGGERRDFNSSAESTILELPPQYTDDFDVSNDASPRFAYESGLEWPSYQATTAPRLAAGPQRDGPAALAASRSLKVGREHAAAATPRWAVEPVAQVSHAAGHAPLWRCYPFFLTGSPDGRYVECLADGPGADGGPHLAGGDEVQWQLISWLDGCGEPGEAAEALSGHSCQGLGRADLD